eukprot:6745049-Pyramimonas_sp.AAC.1
MPGGMSGLMRFLLNELFFNAGTGFHVGDVGMQLPFKDGPAWLHAKTHIVAADEKALKEAFCAKGASGFR